MEVEKISLEEFEAAQANPRKGKWTEIIEQVKETGEPVKVSGLTKGQVAAGARAAKRSGLRIKADYKNGTLYIAP